MAGMVSLLNQHCVKCKKEPSCYSLLRGCSKMWLVWKNELVLWLKIAIKSQMTSNKTSQKDWFPVPPWLQKPLSDWNSTRMSITPRLVVSDPQIALWANTGFANGRLQSLLHFPHSFTPHPPLPPPEITPEYPGISKKLSCSFKVPYFLLHCNAAQIP